VQRLWRATHDGRELKITADESTPPLLAFIGVRACELQAIAVQDQVFTGGAYRDPVYSRRRERIFILAVNCTRPGGTCFCTSMGCGPKVTRGYDLSLTELIDGGGHRFTVEVGSDLGGQVLGGVTHRPAQDEECQAAGDMVRDAAERMGRVLDTAGIKELLYRNYEHPRWDDVAQRCLSCANCTMVCPTCFCSTVEDTTDLTGEHAERWRKWDSCFNLDFSYIHGGSVRSSTRSRYRQWMVHKLATWYDQFGTSGCVGCGRCITWCPVGIDITQELRAIRGAASSAPEDDHGKPAESTR
jgi:ferredoxin